MKKLQIRVELLEIWKTETVGNNGFEKRIAIVQTLEQYPSILKVEFTQGNVNLLDNYNSGELVYLTFNLKGNKVTKEGKDMYFQSINVWQISRQENGSN